LRVIELESYSVIFWGLASLMKVYAVVVHGLWSRAVVFIAVQYSIVNVFHNMILHFLGGHLDCFQIWPLSPEPL
jgi:hypothetical protein